MNNIKDDFKCWLIKQGISDKLINGKSSTLYEYVRQLNVLSEKLYNTTDWDLLIENAPILIFFFLLCGKAKYKNNNYSFNEFQQYIINNKQIVISPYIMETFSQYKAKEEELLQLLNNKSFNTKASVSFIKFYQFLNEDKNKFEISIDEIKHASSQIIKIHTMLKLVPISASRPAEIKITNQNMAQKITIEELKDFLDCSRSTIERLLKKKCLELNIDSINIYLMEHYHPSVLTRIYSPDFFNEKWYTIAEAADFLNCSQSTIKRMLKNRLLSFTDYSAHKIKILGHDLNFHKK
ncbi:MAG: helix-turn-helix domain-containing protein [Alphaproteobacteria bacterium]|nr:helix-turn-helix domain-containing protein [Alphaproteobacteria bacterium]